MSDPKLIEVQEDGHRLSPMLPPEVKNFLIDIDGTICEDIPNEEPWRMADAAVFPDVVNVINGWFAEGHVITFFTSRTEDHRGVTEEWLRKNGFRWHGLLMGKPRGGNYHWIDNHTVRATRFIGKFTELVEKEAVVQVFKE